LEKAGEVKRFFKNTARTARIHTTVFIKIGMKKRLFTMDWFILKCSLICRG
jgi:hypothetical protein